MKLSIIILEYHSISDLGYCLNSIHDNLNDLDAEIIVSSNSCYEKAKQEKLSNDFSDITWIFNEQNLGFAKGTNQGIRKASGDFFMILNVDARIKTNLNIPIKYLQENGKTGLIGPQIIDNIGNIQDSCRPFMTPALFLKRMKQRFIDKKDVLLNSDFEYNKPQTVDWVIGACMMISRKTLDKVGLLDEKYFLYVEDMDWCKRMWENDFEVMYLPEFKVEYKGDRKSLSPALSRKFINKYSWYHFKSYMRFLIKNILTKSFRTKS